MNTKIVICFIVLWFFFITDADATEVWALKNSGFIKSNESISFENYTIKVNTFDNKIANITIYKDQNQIETSDFNINDFKKYDDIKITLLGIKGDYSRIAISKLDAKGINALKSEPLQIISFMVLSFIAIGAIITGAAILVHLLVAIKMRE